jgi:hypothetical protein
MGAVGTPYPRVPGPTNVSRESHEAAKGAKVGLWLVDHGSSRVRLSQFFQILALAK